MARQSTPKQGPIQPTIVARQTATLRFPVEVFPSPLRRFIEEVAEALPCPPDFVGVPLLAVLGAAVGTSRVLQVKPGWHEGPRLFTAVVADPGSKKSPALALVMQPLRERQQQVQPRAQHAQLAEGHVLHQTSALPPAGDPGEAPPSSPSMRPQWYTTDATLEALIQLLHDNPRGLLFVRDELTAWVLSMNAFRRGKGSDRQTWLSLWNGADIMVNRKTRKEVTMVPNPFVGVTGCLSPDVVPDLADPLRRADGLLDRVLFAFPEAAPPRWTDASVTEATMAGYTQVLAGLWQLEAVSGPEVGHGSRPVVMTLTSDGRAAFVEFAKALYAQLADPNLPEHLRGPYAKLEGYTARLALLLHLCRLVAGEADHDAVDARSVAAATTLIAYFQAHMTRVYAQLWSTRADQRAATALRWIRIHGGACTVRDLQRHRVAGVTRASQAEKLVRDLVDLGAGQLRDRQLPSGRRQPVFVIHPDPASSHGSSTIRPE